MNEDKNPTKFLERYKDFQNQTIHGRYLSLTQLEPELEKLKGICSVEVIGTSVKKQPLYSLRLGNGTIKILAWSQMHGNESTTTKSLLDLLQFFRQFPEDEDVNSILSRCTIQILPMLNPDGAEVYTRVNANGVDLNRDAFALEQPESRALRNCFRDFQPHYCLNLHDQRSIFGAGSGNQPATVSFLAPASDPEKKITSSRKKAMELISLMNNVLQQYIPGQVGRFDDAFNINCTGDFFQAQEVPTILFEAGHFPGDYLREKVRQFVTLSLFSCLRSIAQPHLELPDWRSYKSIPENRKSFLDVILRKARLKGEIVDIGIQFTERRFSQEVIFEPRIKKIAPNIEEFGHQELQCQGREIKLLQGQQPSENDLVKVFLLNDSKFSIKTQGIE